MASEHAVLADYVGAHAQQGRGVNAEAELTREEFEQNFGELPKDGEGEGTEHPGFPVVFDEHAIAEDLVHHPPVARRTLKLLR
jgi:hypothetical protein